MLQLFSGGRPLLGPRQRGESAGDRRAGDAKHPGPRPLTEVWGLLQRGAEAGIGQVARPPAGSTPRDAPRRVVFDGDRLPRLFQYGYPRAIRSDGLDPLPARRGDRDCVLRQELVVVNDCAISTPRRGITRKRQAQRHALGANGDTHLRTRRAPGRRSAGHALLPVGAPWKFLAGRAAGSASSPPGMTRQLSPRARR